MRRKAERGVAWKRPEGKEGQFLMFGEVQFGVEECREFGRNGRETYGGHVHYRKTPVVSLLRSRGCGLCIDFGRRSNLREVDVHDPLRSSNLLGPVSLCTLSQIEERGEMKED